MKINWKIKSEPEIKTTYFYFNGKLSFGKLFNSAKSVFSITFNNFSFGFYPKPSFCRLRNKRNKMYLSIYVGRYYSILTFDQTGLDRNKRFFESSRIN
jgi:hypothetical protein